MNDGAIVVIFYRIINFPGLYLGWSELSSLSSSDMARNSLVWTWIVVWTYHNIFWYFCHFLTWFWKQTVIYTQTSLHIIKNPLIELGNFYLFSTTVSLWHRILRCLSPLTFSYYMTNTDLVSKENVAKKAFVHFCNLHSYILVGKRKQIINKIKRIYIRIPASQVVLVVKSLPASAGDLGDVGLIPGSGRSPGGGQSNPLQYFCLENPMDRRSRQATVHRVAKSQTQLKQLSTTHSTFTYMCILLHICILSHISSLPFASDNDGRKTTSEKGKVGCGYWDCPLEKEMATHSSILACSIAWIGDWRVTVYGVAKSRAWLSTHARMMGIAFVNTDETIKPWESDIWINKVVVQSAVWRSGENKTEGMKM